MVWFFLFSEFFFFWGGKFWFWFVGILKKKKVNFKRSDFLDFEVLK